MANLSLFDAFVLLSYISAVVLFGSWIGRGRQDANQYLRGGNDTPWWAILGSIVATETSTVTFLSVPGIAFYNDLRFLQLALGFIVGRIIIVLWLLPLYFRGELFTVYELLQQRFGTPTRMLASLIFIVTRNLGDGLRLFLTAVVLEATLGWSLPRCVIAIGVATIIFTVLGGLKSVIWNDCIQLVVYIGGGMLALVLILGRLDGGFAEMLAFAKTQDSLRMFDFEFRRFDETYTFWAGLIGGTFLTLGTHGTDQMFVQRVLAARSQNEAGRALIFSGFFVFMQFALFLFVGIALAAFYHSHAPNKVFESSDRIFADYIVHEMPQGIGVVGLLLAAVFSAAMSTLSSSLNSSATSVVGDWILPSMRQDSLSDQKIVWLSKLLTIAFGVIQIMIGIWAASFDKAVITNALAIAGFSAGLLLGLFAIGTLLPSAGQTAAIAGLVGGTIVLLVLRFGLTYQVAWPWLPVIGSISTFATAAGFVLCYPQQDALSRKT